MKTKIVENKEKGEFAVLVNPIGDEQFGFLHWDSLDFFNSRKEAKNFITKLEKLQ